MTIEQNRKNVKFSTKKDSLMLFFFFNLFGALFQEIYNVLMHFFARRFMRLILGKLKCLQEKR